MIKTQDLEHLLKLALLSPYIKNERPVSVLISARVESGKTELLQKADGLKGVIYLNDATAYGIQKNYLAGIADGSIKTLVMPDLITPLSRAPDTVETFVTFLNGLIEEGIVRMQTYATDISYETPARCNIITSISKEHLFDQRHRWSKIGFISRVLPVSYEYASSTVYDIQQSISNKEYQKELKYTDLVLPGGGDVDITLPKGIAQQLASLAPMVIDQGHFADKLYGFRLQKQLQTLTMANALFYDRNTANQEDFDKIKYLSDFINLKFKQV